MRTARNFDRGATGFDVAQFQEVFDRAVAFANRLMKENLANDQATIRRAFQLAFARTPTERELKACVSHWRQTTEDEKSKTYERPLFPDKVTRTVMAEKTGQPYHFEEFMPAYTNYQQDLHPADVDAKTRGLGHVCRVLLNTNEFSYLD